MKKSVGQTSSASTAAASKDPNINSIRSTVPIKSASAQQQQPTQRKTVSGSFASNDPNQIGGIKGLDERKRPQTNADNQKPKLNSSNSMNIKPNRPASGAVKSLAMNHNFGGGTNQANQNNNNNNNINSNRTEEDDLLNEKVVLPKERQNLIKMISEFLLKNNCSEANTSFMKEIMKPSNPKNKRFLLFSSLMSAFESGKRDSFFNKWNTLPHAKQTQTIDKVEFYLQIYFLIYEIHPLFKSRDNISNERIDYFRQYLDSKGSELSKTTELLSFYALPYIPNPSEHQGFKQLFTKEWVDSLSLKLQEALDKLVTKDGGASTSTSTSAPASAGALDISELEQFFKDNKDNTADPQSSSFANDNSILRANNAQYLNVIQELNTRYYNLHKVYVQVQEQAKLAIMDSQQKWFSIGQNLAQLSKELIGMIEGVAKGSPLQIGILESKKKKLSQFEHFLSSNIEDLVQQNQSQDISLFEKHVSIIEYDQNPSIFPNQLIPQMSNSDSHNQVHLQQQQQSSQQHQQQQQQLLQQQHQQHQNSMQSNQNQQQQQQQNKDEFQSYVPIDFAKIKTTLKSETQPNQVKIAILQALRWRISKTKNAFNRREVIISYTMHDILGCHQHDVALLNALFTSSNVKQTELALRLVNALASDFEGRSYLVESESLVILLIQILQNEREDTCTRRNALGALQKLSLRKKPQIVMIQNNLINWIVFTLRNEKDELSEYSYEYATALFMNLSLRSLGRSKCEDPSIRVLEVLQQLLEHENHQVRTFVNGTLYSLLGRKALKEQSRELDLLNYLMHLRDNSDERFHKQLHYIIDQLEKPDKEDEEDDNLSDQEDDNDEDDIEDENMNEDDEEGDEGEAGEEDDEEEDYAYYQNSNDPLQDQQSQNSLVGENLLMQMFHLRGPEALRQHNLTRTALEESKRNAQNLSVLNQSRINNRPEPFNRPATPSLSISQISHSQIAGTSFNESKRGKAVGNNILSQQNGIKQNQYGNNQYNPIQQHNSHSSQYNQGYYQQNQVYYEGPTQPQQQQNQQQYQQQQKYHDYQSQQQQLQQRQNQQPQQNSYNAPGQQPSQQYQQQQSYQSQQQQQMQPNQKQVQQKRVPSATKQPQAQKEQLQDTLTKEAFAAKPKIPRTPPSGDEIPEANE